MTSNAHVLLQRVLPLLINETISFVEAVCHFDGHGNPVAGSCLPEAVDDLKIYLQIIRDIESEIGPTTEVEPEWFEDLVARRWSLTACAGTESSTKEERRCRECGCTETSACRHPTYGNCWWVEDDLCSHCKFFWGNVV